MWAAPWSPPAEWKDNHDVNNGGHLLPVQRSGHQVWQTEYTDLRDTPDTNMGSAFTIAAHIHADLVQGNVSAWHHWQFVAAPPYPHSGLMDGKELTFPWTTSDALALQQSGRLVVRSDGTFTATLPARSVTTLVSDLPGAKPAAPP